GPLGVLMLQAAVSNIPPEPGRRPSAILLERARQLQDMLDRAEARGELPPSVDELLELVVAPLYFHALFGQPADAEHARRLVDRLLASPATRRLGKDALRLPPVHVSARTDSPARITPNRHRHTSRLRVRCSGVLFIQSTSVFTLARWQDIRNTLRRSTVCVRIIPRSNGTYEHTLSK